MRVQKNEIFFGLGLTRAGRSMPDNAMLLDLCKALDVSLNELLSGEKLSQDKYGGKAEENMIHLMEENAKQKSTNRWTIVGTIIGIILLCAALLYTIIQSAGVRAITWFLDFPSFMLVTGIPMIVLAAAGMVKDFFYGFRICYDAEYEASKQEALQAYVAIKIVMKTSILTGGVMATINIVLILGTLADIYTMGLCLAVALISIIYSLLLNILLMSTAARLKVITETIL